MLSALKALACVVFLSTVVSGTTIEDLEQFEIIAQPRGIDVSAYQPNINWTAVDSHGVSFVYIKATEGTNYKNPQFSSQYTGATKAHLIRGGYHFALPDKSSGAAQAEYFYTHGGGWTPDNITLPGAVDLEGNPYGAKCYGLKPPQMVDWIRDFSRTYHAKTSRYPVIYTSTSWWSDCTGSSGDFGSTSPLWIARWSSSVGPLPHGWSGWTFWQYANSGPDPGDQDRFNGDLAGLKKFAHG